jgi:hypothetical protein
MVVAVTVVALARSLLSRAPHPRWWVCAARSVFLVKHVFSEIVLVQKVIHKDKDVKVSGQSPLRHVFFVQFPSVDNAESVKDQALLPVRLGSDQIHH